MSLYKRKILLNLEIALRSLCNFRVRSMLAVAGVFIGTLSLVVVANISDALTLKTLLETEKLGKNLLVVRSGVVKKFGRRTKLFSEATNLKVEDALLISEGVSEVVEVTPATNRIFPVRYKNTTLSGVLVVGTRANFPRVRDFYPAQGRFFTPEEDRKLEKFVILGSSVAEKLFGEEDPIGRFIYIYRAPCKVIGVMEPKGVDLSGADQDNQIIMPLNTYLRRFVNKSYINMIYVKVADDKRIGEAKRRIEEVLNKSHGIREGKEQDFTVIDLRDMVSLKTEALKIVKTLGSIAGVVAFLIGGIGILSIMILIVNERKVEIGIRRAVGSRKKDILTQFLIESIFISLLGGTAGVTAGMILSLLVSIIADFPFTASLMNLIIALSASVLVGLIAGVYPSFKATSYQPVEVLKG
jgi:putative ABC transport system permease protein